MNAEVAVKASWPKLDTPIVLVAVATFVGVAFVVWHTWVPREDDGDWNDPQQPEQNVNIPYTRPGECSMSFRGRSHKGNLYENRGGRPTILGMTNGY